jgi:hypothetical protein
MRFITELPFLLSLFANRRVPLDTTNRHRLHQKPSRRESAPILGSSADRRYVSRINGAAPGRRTVFQPFTIRPISAGFTVLSQL